MMTRQHRAAQVIEAYEAALAQVTLAMPLHLVATVLDNRAAGAAWTAHAIWPPMLPNKLEAFRVIDQRSEINQV
jgi:hypothetical protein